jgi:hypothetical protein
MRMMRSSMLEVLNEDYMRTAHANHTETRFSERVDPRHHDYRDPSCNLDCWDCGRRNRVRDPRTWTTTPRVRNTTRLSGYSRNCGDYIVHICVHEPIHRYHIHND